MIYPEMGDSEENSLSTDSSDLEESDVTESTPDGLKLKKKLLTLIKRVRRSRKLSTRNEEEHVADVNDCHVQGGGNTSADDKCYPVFSPVSAFGMENTNTCSYTLSKRKRGLALFIINSEFIHQPHRPFTKIDVHFMTKLFRHLGFEIKLLENKKGRELWKDLREIRRSITSDYDCFVCVISSHGAEFPLSRWLDPDRKLRQHVIFTKDGEIPTDRILEEFSDDRCANLIGKPRMFFIQACRCVMGSDEEFDIDKGVDIEVINQEYPVLYVRRYKTRSDDVKDVKNGPHVSSYSDTGDQTRCSKVTPDARGRPEDSSLDSSQPDTRGRSEDSSLDSSQPDTRGIPEDSTLDSSQPDTRGRPEDSSLDSSQPDTRGRPEDSGLDSSQPDTSGRPEDSSKLYGNTREMYFRSKEPSSFCFIPCYEDFLVMFSSASERTAWSDKGKGGWLLYCLYKVFKRLLVSNYEINILQILTDVSGNMSRELRAEYSSNPLLHHSKSVATLHHMLTKEIYLQPKLIQVRPVQESAV